MKKNPLLIFLVTAFLQAFAFSCAIAAPAVPGPLRSGMNVRHVEHGGLERVYMVYVPSTYEKASPAPLVFVLHGGRGTAKGISENFGFNELAERQKAVIVYPQGYKNHWNDSRVDIKTSAHELNVDDPGFISSVMDTVSAELNIDKKMVFSVGISNGAMMSQRLALEMSDKFAAIGCVVGSVPETLVTKKMTPKSPVSVVMFNGTDDPLVPWKGGEVAKNRGRVISVMDAVNMWVKFDGCSTTPKVENVPDKDKSDGVAVKKEIYSGGKNSSEVVLYTMEGGGHTWPGRKIGGWFYNRVVHKTCMDMDATEAIWLFLKSHGRK